jgi:hypothetical protein
MVVRRVLLLRLLLLLTAAREKEGSADSYLPGYSEPQWLRLGLGIAPPSDFPQTGTGRWPSSRMAAKSFECQRRILAALNRDEDNVRAALLHPLN